jgi:uncharacterized pyridoxamine 5'-phosphate oxidase family protein
MFLKMFLTFENDDQHLILKGTPQFLESRELQRYLLTIYLICFFKDIYSTEINSSLMTFHVSLTNEYQF